MIESAMDRVLDNFNAPDEEEEMKDDADATNHHSKSPDSDERTRSVSTPRPRRRHIGMVLATRIVDQLVESQFYGQNDGAAILDNPDGFRTSDQVQQQWLKQRQGLTLDWKRKRKHAQSRIQKRMKLR